MSTISHNHDDKLTVDSDVHFTIDTVTRMISNQNGEEANKKLILTQYDNNSERYSFDIDRIIENHDLLNCNRVQVHYVNAGPGKNDKPNIGSYLIPIEDIREHETNPNKLTFSWLISRNATLLNGTLSFAISFECIDGDKILYRWSTATFEGIRVAVGMDNDNAIMEHYVDELLVWQNNMETELLPNLVDECYVDREFATSEEVRKIFDIYDPATDELIGTDTIPTDGSNNLVTSGGVKYYTDNAINDVKDIFNDYYTKDETYSRDEINEIIAGGEVDLSDYYKKSETYSQTEVNDLIDNVQVDLSDYYKKSETYSQAEIDEKVENVQVDLSDYYKKSETYSQTEVNDIVDTLENSLDNKADKSEIPDISGKADKTEIPDISGKADKTELNNYVTNTALESKGYLTEIPSEYVTETELTAKKYATTSELESGLSGKADKSEIPDISGKVDKVDGKDLSTNDYTTAEKNKLAGLENYDDSTIQQSITELQNGKADKSEIPDISGKADKSEIPTIKDQDSVPLSIGEVYSNPTVPSVYNLKPLTERAIATGLPYINGSHTYTDAIDIYAPTSSGTTGQILVANTSSNTYGSWDTVTEGGTPEWKNPSELGLVTTDDLATKADKTELEDYVKVADIADNLITFDAKRPLSANQGATLNQKIIPVADTVAEIASNYLKTVTVIPDFATGGNVVTVTKQDGTSVSFDTTDGCLPVSTEYVKNATISEDVLTIVKQDNTEMEFTVSGKADQTSLDTTNSNVSALQKRVSDNEVDITTLFNNVNGVKTQYLKDATVLSDFSTGGSRVTITKQDDTTVSFDTTDGCLPSSTKYLKTATISEDGKQLILTKQDNTTVLFEGGGLEEDGSLSQIRIKELWTNNSPTLSFASQTIDLNSNDYDFLLFIYCFYSYNSDYEMSVVCQKGNNAIMTGDINASSSPYVRTLSRSAIYNNDTSYTFDSCYHSSSSGTSINNEYLVPKCIYGIKKQPAMIYTGTELFEGNGISIENGVISQKNSAITIQLSSAYEMPSKSQESPAMTQVVKVGDKLSFINNEIVVGSGVSVVRASSKAFYIPYAAASVYCYIVKNGNNLTIDTNYTASAKAMNIGTSNILIPVVEGDRIGIAFYTSASGSLQGGNYRTYLTVEVVE